MKWTVGRGTWRGEWQEVHELLKQKKYDNKKIKNPSNIGIKVPDKEWQTKPWDVKAALNWLSRLILYI